MALIFCQGRPRDIADELLAADLVAGSYSHLRVHLEGWLAPLDAPEDRLGEAAAEGRQRFGAARQQADQLGRGRLAALDATTCLIQRFGAGVSDYALLCWGDGAHGARASGDTTAAGDRPGTMPPEASSLH